MQTTLPGFSAPPLPDDSHGQISWKGREIPYRIRWTRDGNAVRYELSDCGLLQIYAPFSYDNESVIQKISPDFPKIFRQIRNEEDHRRSLSSESVFMIHDIPVRYTVSYSQKRRRDSLIYHHDGALEVIARSDATKEEIANLLKNNSDWIYGMILRYDPRYRRPDDEKVLQTRAGQIRITIRYHVRAKRLTLKVKPDKRVMVVAPYDCSSRDIDRFIQENHSWLLDTLGIASSSQPDESAIRFFSCDGIRIPYRVRTSRRAKNIILKVTAEKNVEVVVPPGASIGRVDQFVLEKAGWVMKQVTSTARPVAPTRMFRDGEELLLLGREYHLEVTDDAKWKKTEVRDGIIRVPVPSDLAVSEHRPYIRREYLQVLQSVLREVSEPILHSWCDVLKIPLPAIKYGNQKTKWGVCSPRGIILNIRLAMAPVELIEYVIVHELCHIRHPNHSEKFWGLVELLLPDYRDRKNTLRLQGPLYSI